MNEVNYWYWRMVLKFPPWDDYADAYGVLDTSGYVTPEKGEK